MPALRLRAVAGPHRRREDDVGVLRVDRDPRDPPGLLQAHLLPGLAGVGGLVDPVAQRDVGADERLAGADPHDVGIGRGDRDRADGLRGLVVEDRAPVDSAVDGLPHAARGRADVVGVRVARHSDDGGDPVARRADEAVLQGRVGIKWLIVGARASRGRSRGGRGLLLFRAPAAPRRPGRSPSERGDGSRGQPHPVLPIGLGGKITSPRRVTRKLWRGNGKAGCSRRSGPSALKPKGARIR